MDVRGLKINESVNDCSTAAVDYQSYYLFKNQCRYENDVAHEL